MLDFIQGMLIWYALIGINFSLGAFTVWRHLQNRGLVTIHGSMFASIVRAAVMWPIYMVSTWLEEPNEEDDE